MTLEERLNILEDKVTFLIDYLERRSIVFSAEWHEHEDENVFRDFSPDYEEDKPRGIKFEDLVK